MLEREREWNQKNWIDRPTVNRTQNDWMRGSIDGWYAAVGLENHIDPLGGPHVLEEHVPGRHGQRSEKSSSCWAASASDARVGRQGVVAWRAVMASWRVSPHRSKIDDMVATPTSAQDDFSTWNSRIVSDTWLQTISCTTSATLVMDKIIHHSAGIVEMQQLNLPHFNWAGAGSCPSTIQWSRDSKKSCSFNKCSSKIWVLADVCGC